MIYITSDKIDWSIHISLKEVEAILLLLDGVTGDLLSFKEFLQEMYDTLK